MTHQYLCKAGKWYHERDLRLFVEPYKAGKSVRQIAEDTHYSESHIYAALKAAGAWKGKNDNQR